MQVNGRNSRFLSRKPLPTEESYCKNCGTHFSGFYCPRCGQNARTRRLSLLNTIEDTVGLLTNLDSGILRTCSELFWRPGHMMRDYIQGHRKGYMKPLSLLFCIGTIYYFLIYFFAQDALMSDFVINDELSSNQETEKYVPILTVLGEYLKQWLNNPALVHLSLILPMVPATWLCFRKTTLGKALNLMELFHIQVLMACQMLIVTFFSSIYSWITGGHLSYNDLQQLPIFLLFVWDYKQLYNIGWKRSFRLTLLCIIVTFVIAILMLAALASLVALYIYLKK